ncbi:MAG: tetratricopeptide repeat protein [Armatimonadota bacterium]
MRALPIAGFVVAGASLAAATALAGRIRPEVVSTPRTGIVRDRVADAARSTLFGTFRTSMADFLWLKMDRVVHNGVEVRPAAEPAGHTRASDDEDHDHGHEETVVRPKESDWRGVLGEVERATQPYEAIGGHVHRDPSEALPLFRLMTTANPHFIDGYVTGAYVLSRDPGGLDRALEFLREGATNNPEDLRIASAMGTLLTRKARRFDDALPHLVRAIEIAARRDPGTLTEDERDAWQDAVRALATGRLLAGDREFAIRAARAGLAQFPDDPTCRRVLADARAK